MQLTQNMYVTVCVCLFHLKPLNLGLCCEATDLSTTLLHTFHQFTTLITDTSVIEALRIKVTSCFLHTNLPAFYVTNPVGYSTSGIDPLTCNKVKVACCKYSVKWQPHYSSSLLKLSISAASVRDTKALKVWPWFSVLKSFKPPFFKLLSWLCWSLSVLYSINSVQVHFQYYYLWEECKFCNF